MNMQLKVYASHGYQCISDTFQAKDIGVTLPEEAISSNFSVDHSLIISMPMKIFVVIYDTIGFAMITLLYILAVSKNTTVLSSKDNIILLKSIALIGIIWLLIEFIGTLLHIIEGNLVCISIILIILTLLGYIILLLHYALNKWNYKSKNIGNMLVTLHIVTCLLPVFHFALPTFLLSLVYPMKVIVIITQTHCCS